MVKLHVTLNDFDVSPTVGFLIENPARSLPSYFDPWSLTAVDIAALIREHRVRQAIDQLPLLDTSRLPSWREQRLAHAHLITLTAAYVWCEGEYGVPAILPRNVAIPLWSLSGQLGLPPILCYASFCLANCVPDDPTEPFFTTCDRAHVLTAKFIDEFDIDWFALVTAQVESDFAEALPAIFRTATAVRDRDDDAVRKLADTLGLLDSTLQKMRSSLQRIHERMDPDTFFHRIRPWLAGYDNNAKMIENNPPDGGIVFK